MAEMKKKLPKRTGKAQKQRMAENSFRKSKERKEIRQREQRAREKANAELREKGLPTKHERRQELKAATSQVRAVEYHQERSIRGFLLRKTADDKGRTHVGDYGTILHAQLSQLDGGAYGRGYLTTGQIRTIHSKWKRIAAEVAIP